MSRRARAAEGSSVTAFSDDERSSGGGAPPSAEWKELMALSPDDLEDALQLAGSALKEGRELKTSAKAVLALQLDDDDALAEPEQLLHALRIAQVALRGERARGDAGEKAAAAGGTAGSAGTARRSCPTTTRRLWSTAQNSRTPRASAVTTSPS